MIYVELVRQHDVVCAKPFLPEYVIVVQVLIDADEFCVINGGVKPNLSFDDPSERIHQTFVLSDYAARHEPFAFGWRISSKPDKHALIWIANYQVNRN